MRQNDIDRSIHASARVFINQPDCGTSGFKFQLGCCPARFAKQNTVINNWNFCDLLVTLDYDSMNFSIARNKCLRKAVNNRFFSPKNHGTCKITRDGSNQWEMAMRTSTTNNGAAEKTIRSYPAPDLLWIDVFDIVDWSIWAMWLSAQYGIFCRPEIFPVKFSSFS